MAHTTRTASGELEDFLIKPASLPCRSNTMRRSLLTFFAPRFVRLRRLGRRLLDRRRLVDETRLPRPRPRARRTAGLRVRDFDGRRGEYTDDMTRVCGEEPVKRFATGSQPPRDGSGVILTNGHATSDYRQRLGSTETMRCKTCPTESRLVRVATLRVALAESAPRFGGGRAW